MFADRQTDAQTDGLITIHRTSTGQSNKYYLLTFEPRQMKRIVDRYAAEGALSKFRNKNKYTSYPDWRISPHADPLACILVYGLRGERHQKFSLFGFGVLTKIGDGLLPTRSTIMPHFIALCQPTPEISDTKLCRQPNKQ